MTIAFLGLLFAVLASGCQSSDLPSKERELTSQVYGMPLSSSFRNDPLIVSVLFVPMPANDKLLITTYDRSHSNALDHRQCIIL